MNGAWKLGAVLRVENPPPDVICPPVVLWHAISAEEDSAPCVAPTAVTYGEEAGKEGL